MLKKFDIEVWQKKLQEASDREFDTLSKSMKPRHTESSRKLEFLAASAFTKNIIDDGSSIQKEGPASKITTNMSTLKL